MNHLATLLLWPSSVSRKDPPSSTPTPSRHHPRRNRPQKSVTRLVLSIYYLSTLLFVLFEGTVLSSVFILSPSTVPSLHSHCSLFITFSFSPLRSPSQECRNFLFSNDLMFITPRFTHLSPPSLPPYELEVTPDL